MISLRRLNRLVTLKAFGRRFVGDGRGVSAIEFALVAPVLILLYLGMAELTLGMMAARRVSHLAATVGDMAAQSQSLTPTNITDLWAIGANMLDPFPTSGTSLRIRLTSVTMQSTKKATVDWSEPSNWTKHTNSDKAITDITTDQIAVGESLILTEVEYDYDSPIGNFFKTGTVFKDTFMHHPRNGSEVTCPLCP